MGDWQAMGLTCYAKEMATLCFVCLFDLILYVPVNNFSVMSGRVFLG